MLVVRPASVADAARCADIYAPFVNDSWVSFEQDAPDASEMADRITKALHSHDWLVAEIEDQIVGYAYGAAHRARAAYKSSCDVTVYVDPAYSRMGAGRSLYDALLNSLKAKGMHAAFAGIALPNDASLALHKVTGFEPIGVYKEVGRKMDAWRDVLWLQRLL